MINKSWMTVGIVLSVFTLSACQTLTVNSSKPNHSNIYDNKVYQTPTTLIPPIPDSDGDSVLDDIDACPKTPANVVVDASGCPVNIHLMDATRMELRVFFERNSTEFKVNTYEREVRKVAEQMRKYPELIAVLSGHVSESESIQIQVTPSAQVDQIKFNNNQLARNRVQLVKDRLTNDGIAEDRIHTFDCGDNIQIAPNNTEEGVSMNQRIFGNVMDASRIYSSGSTHSFKRYLEVCQEF